MKQEVEAPKEEEKVLITGDDILIEYVDRVIQRVNQYNSRDLREEWTSCMDKFSNHYVWHSKDKEFQEKPRVEQM